MSDETPVDHPQLADAAGTAALALAQALLKRELGRSSDAARFQNELLGIAQAWRTGAAVTTRPPRDPTFQTRVAEQIERAVRRAARPSKTHPPRTP